MYKIREEELFKNQYNDNYEKFFEERTCLCLNDNKESLFDIDRYNLKTKVSLCNYCGLVYANKVLPKKKLIEFYSSDAYRYFYNFIGSNTGLKEDDYIDDQVNDKISINNSLALIKKNFKNNINETVLELGSGYAQLSRSLNIKGRLVAIDYSKKAIDYLNRRNIEAYQGGVEILNEINLKYDLIILCHVVEHFYNFYDELAEIIKYLKNDGIIYIEVPNLDSKYNLDQIQNAHNYYFTKNTLIYNCSKLGLSSEQFDPKVNQIHLGVIFSKKNKQINDYNFKEEIIKIRKFHKKYLKGINKIKRIKIFLFEKIKKFIGVELTIIVRKVLSTKKNW